MNTREFLINHHSAISHDGVPQLSRIDVSHRGRGFAKSRRGYYVGYHILIEESGRWIQTRDFDEEGFHDVNCGCDIDLSRARYGTLNIRALGICLAGNFTVHAPKLEQIETLHDLTISLYRTYNVSNLLHRETKRTACPGVDLRMLVEEYHKTQFVPKRLEEITQTLEHTNIKGYRRTRLERIAARYARFLLSTPS